MIEHAGYPVLILLDGAGHLCVCTPDQAPHILQYRASTYRSCLPRNSGPAFQAHFLPQIGLAIGGNIVATAIPPAIAVNLFSSMSLWLC